MITTLAGSAFSVFAADLDGDGDLDALSASSDDKIAWYENTNSDGTFGTQQVISTLAEGLRGIFPADVDGDGDVDVLSASGVFPVAEIAWYENIDGFGSFGAQQLISTFADQASSVFGADVDGDGDLDVLSTAIINNNVAWYENTDGVGSFGSQQVISTLADQANSVFAADVDGDGDVDVLSASFGDDKIAWYENTDGAGSFGPQQVISTLADRANSVFAADVDGDGDVDALSASYDAKIAWYENTDGAGSFGSEQVLSTVALFASSVFAGDVDGDGDLDVLSASGFSDHIAWYENTDGDGSFGSQVAISTVASGAKSVFAADVDGDGDLDVLSASRYDNKIAWYENETIHRSAVFPERAAIYTRANLAFSTFAADIDGDGDLDVLSTSWTGGIAWYENTDGNGSFGPLQVISTLADGAFSVFAADVDGDGDLDVLSASVGDDKVAWYENTDGEGSFGPQRVITTLADAASSVVSADVDGDGDLDVLSASVGDDKIAWYENTDGAGSFGSQQVISTLADGAASVLGADIDGDGDIDVLSASQFDDTIAWYENRGGQFSLSTIPTAQGVLANSQEELLFQIDLEHRGRIGDSAVELATLELLLEDGFGQPLDSVQANDLIDKLEVFVDTGSGSFEPDSDSLVELVTFLAPTDGVESIPFATGDPRARIAFASSQRYFVVVTMTGDADQRTPDSFEVTHLTEATSSGRDASAPTVPLTLEHAPNTTTGLIDTDLTTASCQAPFELDLEAFTVLTTVVCEAGTVLTARGGLHVVSPGDLTLRAGERIVLGVDFSVGTGGTLAAETDASLQP